MGPRRQERADDLRPARPGQGARAGDRGDAGDRRAGIPDTVYRIVGATPPEPRRARGEAYREKLQARAEELGVADHILWDNRFLDTDELLDQLEACDIYVTPYFNLQQSTSGTLSYAVALGKAVVSTPLPPCPRAARRGCRTAHRAGQRPGDCRRGQRAARRARRRCWRCSAAPTRRAGRRSGPAFADGAAALIEAAVAPRPTRGPLTATPGA
jgi:hypothetical protein